jgi:preprotein translocase subunit SecF
MKNICLQTVSTIEVPEKILNTDTTNTSIWFWIVVIELVFITYLLFKLWKKNSKLKFNDATNAEVHNAKKSDIDMDNLMNSINGSKDLYKELSRACHPDRFINTDKQKMAEDLFQEISKNRRDYEKLNALKQIAITNLNINFK